MPFYEELRAALDLVDDPDVLEVAKTSPIMHAALEMARPENWWGSGADPDGLLKIATEDAIPVTWVPRTEILIDLAKAPNRRERLDLLLRQWSAIVDDCARVVDECTDQWLNETQPLAAEAVRALRAGHHQPAMALAVSLGEPLAVWASTPRVKAFDSREAADAWEKQRKRDGKYNWARQELAVVGDATSERFEFKRKVLIAPIPKFFEPWWPNQDIPEPDDLSRHVVAHSPTVRHFSRVNALKAVMLMTSLLREQQSWSVEVRMMDEPGSE
jgi:hypothetical protein